MQGNGTDPLELQSFPFQVKAGECYVRIGRWIVSRVSVPRQFSFERAGWPNVS